MKNIIHYILGGLLLTALQPLFADSNIVVFEYDKKESKDYEDTAQKIIDAVEKKSDLYAEDLTYIVGIAPEDHGKVKKAFPTPLQSECRTPSCNFTGSGQALKVKTSNTTGNPEYDGIALGFNSSIKGVMQTENPASATICNIDGIYLAKLIIRKNVKAFRIEKTAKGVIVTTWLQGAGSLPNCQGK